MQDSLHKSCVDNIKVFGKSIHDPTHRGGVEETQGTFQTLRKCPFVERFCSTETGHCAQDPRGKDESCLKKIRNHIETR